MAWVRYDSEYISFFRAIFIRNLVTPLKVNQIHLYFVVLYRTRHFTCVWKDSCLPSLIIRPGLSFQVVDSQRKLLEKTSSPLSGEYNHIELECKSVSKAVLRIFFTLPVIKWLVALRVLIVWTRPDGCWLGLSSFHFIFGKCHSKKSWL